MNFDQDYFPLEGYSFTSYHPEVTTENGDRTSYSSSLIPNPQNPTAVRFHMHVQGDDGFGGFCKRHGWLGLNIHVEGQRWQPTTMIPFAADVSGKPLQETVLIQYPYVVPSADVRNFQMHYVATVDKVVGDDVSTVQVTDGAPTASGITANADSRLDQLLSTKRRVHFLLPTTILSFMGTTIKMEEHCSLRSYVAQIQGMWQ